MKKLIIVHGYEGTPNANWFSWLESQAKTIRMDVIVPALPNTNTPQLGEWLPFLQSVIADPSEDTYLVGHSLGCATILRYLESLDDGQRIGGAVLVAGFAEPIHLSELDGFTAGPWDDAKIKSSADKIILINSDNDPYVPIEMGERMRDRFGAELVVAHGAGHITASSGYTEAPIIFEQLQKLW